MILALTQTAAMDTSLTESLQGGLLLLIRHGQTAWNAERRFLGRTDVPLDTVGRDQAARLARRLGPIEHVWSSPLGRALETARGLGEPAVDPELTEMDMGALEGLGGAEVDIQFPGLMLAWRDDPENIATPGGERLAEVQERGFRAVSRIAATVGTNRVAVVTHQLLLATVVCRLNGLPRASYRKFMHRNTGITVVEASTLRMVSFDDAAHLEG